MVDRPSTETICELMIITYLEPEEIQVIYAYAMSIRIVRIVSL